MILLPAVAGAAAVSQQQKENERFEQQQRQARERHDRCERRRLSREARGGGVERRRDVLGGGVERTVAQAVRLIERVRRVGGGVTEGVITSTGQRVPAASCRCIVGRSDRRGSSGLLWARRAGLLTRLDVAVQS